MSIDEKSLLIIPCCKRKQQGGIEKPKDYCDPLLKTVTQENYNKVEELHTSSELNCYKKNVAEYIPAIERYDGHLYRAHKEFISIVRKQTNRKNRPKLLILSALYGPLHPETLINNYDLKMPNTKSSIWWHNLPSFLTSYVKQMNINNVSIYCGRSTGYYKVLSKSIIQLLNDGSIDYAIHCNVIDGSSSTTPKNHGLQLLRDLRLGLTDLEFTRKIEKINL